MFFMEAGLAWTVTNILNAIVRNYLRVRIILTIQMTFFVLHWTKGAPYPHLAGKDDVMTVWEQIDNERFYTPTKKVFTAIPIVVYSVSSHYPSA